MVLICSSKERSGSRVTPRSFSGSGDYLQNQFWDTLQAFSSSLSGTLATQAYLRGVGVENQEATVAAATITWLLRGMLGRILFSWLKGLVADVLKDIAMFMEILAPNFPTCFALTSIVRVAGGATRAALTLHQARRDNMADISAKDGSQETLVNLAGLLVSLILIPLVTDNPLLTFTLNEARLAIVLHQYLRDGQVLGPVEANHKEPVFLGMFRRTVPIKLGVRLGELIYTWCMSSECSVCVCLGPDASVCDEIRAVCQAVCLCTVLHPVSPLEGALKQLSMSHNHWELVHESHKLMDQIFQPFLKGKLSVTRCAQTAKTNKNDPSH
uniref:RUS family member 1 n=1 Tax=Oncorhynchus kisutch TaxID=8019 RepID=A0A8C7IK09_ONCKI